MSTLTGKIRDRLFNCDDHPYVIYEKKIDSIIKESDVILDAGCGRTAPVLIKFKDKAQKLIGVDLEDVMLDGKGPKITFLKNDISNMPLDNNSADLIISRSVLEHIKDIEGVYNEIYRILKPQGHFVFLVPNLTDYVSLFSYLIPNCLHPLIVSKMQGRQKEKVFPTYYKSNTFSSISKLSQKIGFKIVTFEYLGSYPYMFMFNSVFFLIASAYEKIISRFHVLRFLRGWLLVSLQKS